MDTPEGNESLKARGVVEIQAGWREYRNVLASRRDPVEEKTEEEKDTTYLPPLKQGDAIQCTSTHLLEKQTTPPKHFTE